MKKIFWILLLVATNYAYGELTADAIMDSVENIGKVKSSKSVMTQISISSSGRKRESKMVIYSKDEGNKSLMVYIEPARIKGMKMLTLNDGDEIWAYMPRTGRVRKIAGNLKKGSMNGSDFSYEDMSMGDRKEDYNVTKEKDEKIDSDLCYVLVYIPKKGIKINYSKMKTWIRKKDFIMLRTDFWDEDKELIKRLTLSNIKKIDGHNTPMIITMENLLKSTKTIMKTESIKYNIEINDNLFSQKSLKR